MVGRQLPVPSRPLLQLGTVHTRTHTLSVLDRPRLLALREARAPRSIRFSDLEWVGIEKESKARGMTAAELVRHAVVELSTGKLAPPAQPFLSEIVA